MIYNQESRPNAIKDSEGFTLSYLEKNDINIYNSIVYQIYNVENIDEMRLTFLKSVKLLIPYESSNFYLADKCGDHLITTPVALNFPLEALTEYLEKIEEADPTRWIFIQAKNMVYRERDLFSAEAIEKNKCYQEFYIPHNLHHSLQISLSQNNIFLGSLSFYRSKDQEEFSDYELYFFDLLKDHLALRLYKELKTSSSKPVAISESDNKIKYGLTVRETEIAVFLIKGLSIEEISEQLFISPNTVKKHIVNIYRKIGITSRRQLYKYVIQ